MEAYNMKYDFTSIMDRQGKDSIAVDVETDVFNIAPAGTTKPGFDRIPMWVADMNFPTVPTIISELTERVQHPAFGYFAPTDDYFNEIIKWHETHNQVTGLTRECIGYENGVIGGLMSTLRVLCTPGEKVLLHSPTYVGFTTNMEGYGYDIVLSPLKLDANGIYRMDYEDMDRKLKENNIHMAVFVHHTTRQAGSGKNGR
jgi:cystathionine beta-lyase